MWCQAVQAQKRGARALVPRTPSLDQAGGVQRITLRGHTGPVTHVLLAEGGIDVVTGRAPCSLGPLHCAPDKLEATAAVVLVLCPGLW